MSMTKKLLFTAICVTAVMLLSCRVFAADEIEVRRINMSSTAATLKVNQSKSLYVNISPANADDKTIVWSSSDTGVATVSDSGGNGAVVTGVSEGRARITATSHNGKTTSCTVTVSDDKIDEWRIEMATETATVRVNQTKTLLVEVIPYDADYREIDWTSSNTEVAMVSSYGIVTGISPGTVEITATSHNGRTAVCTVTVPSSVLTGIERQVQSEDIPSALVDSGELLSAAALRLDVENAAKDSGKSKQIILTYSGKTQVSTAALRSAAFAAAYDSKEAVLRFRTTDGDGKIQGQLTVYPQNAGEADMNVGLAVYTEAKRTETAKSRAEAYFGAPAAVIRLSQEGSFGMTVQAAAKADFTGLDTKSLKIYRYESGTYVLREDQSYRIDKSGYIHFSVSEGGTYVLVSA